MANGFEINITEAEFKAKTQDEQAWILFQGITSMNKCIRDIESNGCQYSRDRHRLNLVKLATAISGSIAFALGMVYVIFHLLHHGGG